MRITSPRLRSGALGALALAALALVLPTATLHASGSDKRVEEARTLVRSGELSKAIGLLNDALKQDPGNVDAHVLYQEAASEVFGAKAVEDDYAKRLAEKPDDLILQFLSIRLMKPDQAARKFEALSRSFKDSPWPLAGKARALEKLGKFKEAVTVHDKAVNLAPEDPRFRAYQAYALEKADRWKGALEAWTQVVRLAPEDRGGQLGLAEATRRMGDADAAVAILADVAKKYPRDPEPKYRMGLAYIDADKYEEAMTALKGALAINREMVPAYCAAAEAAMRDATAKSKKDRKPLKDEDLKEALGFAKKAVEFGAEKPDAQFVYGAVHELMGEWDSSHLDTAIEAYNEAQDLIPFPGPAKVRVLIATAYVYLRLGKWENAIATADLAIGMDKSAVAAYLHAGHAKVRLDKAEDAVKTYYKTALKLDPGNPAVQHGVGTALWDVGVKEWRNAEKALKKAVALEEDNGLYRRSLGQLYYDLGKHKDAVKQLYEATDLRPYDSVAWTAFGRACCQEKHWDDAIEAFEKTVELDPKYVDGHYYLAVIYFDKKKEYEKAQEHIVAFTEKNGKTDATMDAFIKRVLEK